MFSGAKAYNPTASTHKRLKMPITAEIHMIAQKSLQKQTLRKTLDIQTYLSYTCF